MFPAVLFVRSAKASLAPGVTYRVPSCNRTVSGSLLDIGMKMAPFWRAVALRNSPYSGNDAECCNKPCEEGEHPGENSSSDSDSEENQDQEIESREEPEEKQDE